MARQQLGAAPARVADAPTVGFPGPGLGLRPAVGRYATASGVTGYGYNSQTSGVVYNHPLWIGTGFTADAFRTRINNARVGGTAIRKFGLYADAGGYPDTSALLASTSVTDTSTSGNNGSDYTFTGGAVALLPGLYWCSTIYYASVAPTTNSSGLCITQVAYGLPTDDGNAPDAVAKALTLTGRTDLPSGVTAHSSFLAFKGNECPLLLLRRSA